MTNTDPNVERVLVQLASDFWNAHYKASDPNPVQIGVPQLLEFHRAALAAITPEPTVCTCPSGDGSLRWPCPTHPPTSPSRPSVDREAVRLLIARELAADSQGFGSCDFAATLTDKLMALLDGGK